MLTNWESSITLFIFNVIVYALIQYLRVFIDPYLPESWFSPKQKYYKCYAWEDNGKFYDRVFKVSKWKDYLPTVNSSTNFNKKKITGRGVDYFEQFLQEINMAESHHIRSILTTLVFALWNPSGMFIFFFMLSAAAQLPFIIIQRYNRPRMQKVVYDLRVRENTIKITNVAPIVE